jgi:hypothetical protein
MLPKKQSPHTAEAPPVKTATEARAGRIVRGGAMARVVMISVAIAVVAMIVAFMLVR